MGLAEISCFSSEASPIGRKKTEKCQYFPSLEVERASFQRGSASFLEYVDHKEEKRSENSGSTKETHRGTDSTLRRSSPTGNPPRQHKQIDRVMLKFRSVATMPQRRASSLRENGYTCGVDNDAERGSSGLTDDDFSSSLPAEIIFRIFTFLSNSDLIQAAQTSRFWRNLIKEDNHIRAIHLHYFACELHAWMSSRYNLRLKKRCTTKTDSKIKVLTHEWESPRSSWSMITTTKGKVVIDFSLLIKSIQPLWRGPSVIQHSPARNNEGQTMIDTRAGVTDSYHCQMLLTPSEWYVSVLVGEEVLRHHQPRSMEEYFDRQVSQFGHPSYTKNIEFNRDTLFRYVSHILPPPSVSDMWKGQQAAAEHVKILYESIRDSLSLDNLQSANVNLFIGGAEVGVVAPQASHQSPSQRRLILSGEHVDRLIQLKPTVLSEWEVQSGDDITNRVHVLLLVYQIDHPSTFRSLASLYARAQSYVPRDRLHVIVAGLEPEVVERQKKGLAGLLSLQNNRVKDETAQNWSHSIGALWIKTNTFSTYWFSRWGHQGMEVHCLVPPHRESTFVDNMLHELVKKNDLEGLEKHLRKEKGTNVDVKDETGQTPLHIAAYDGHFNIAYLLLSRGADVNSRDQQQWTPLHCSTNQGHLKISSLLLSRGSDPNAVNINRATPFHYVVRSEYSEDLIEVLHLMMENRADIDCKNNAGETPLMGAVSKKMTETVRFLIDYGANVNVKTSSGRTPLHYAVEMNARDISVILLKNGADRDAKMTEEPFHSPQKLAQLKGSPQIREVFAQSSWYEDHTYTSFTREGIEEELMSASPFMGSPSEEPPSPCIDGQNVSPGRRGTRPLPAVPVRTRRITRTESELIPNMPFRRHESGMFMIRPSDVTASQMSVSSPILGSPAINLDLEDPSIGLDIDINNGDAHYWKEKYLVLLEAVKKKYHIDKNIVGHYPGFYEETGVPNPNPEVSLLFQHCNYKNWFYHQEHAVYIGRMNRRNTTDKFEPLIITVTQDIHKYRMIVFTRLGDMQVLLPIHTEVNPRKSLQHSFSELPGKGKQLSKELLQLAKEKIIETRGTDRTELLISLELAGPSYNKENTKEMRDRLLEFEQYDPLKAKCFNVGVLYSKEGQTNEDEQFGNQHPSQAFDDFLNFLGDKIPLNGWLGHRGDLDTSGDTGHTSLYRRWKAFEIMFHVSTLLPYLPGEAQQMHRKRRIGNDIVTIVFQEGGQYTPPIRSQFLHCYVVVSPAALPNGRTGYKVQAACQTGVPGFGPQLGLDCVYERSREFREFLLTKVINSQLAALRHPQLREKIWCRPKEDYLVRIVKDYAKKKEHNTLENASPFT
ncbi:Protein F53A10.2, isoform a [Planoprotostelium fungivorum]|uniref:Protein F53A10.2, isoform a n=1 Tax=Planoprotostelium fungivorum TaxID=1890364 RepID=A0A2P6NS82_9EUKA|nr:Protein F53A10.2, isoform a [Planoprotostelium fungivorum]